MSAIPGTMMQHDSPPSDSGIGIKAMVLAFFGVVVAVWRGISSAATFGSKVMERLNAQDAKIKEQDAALLRLEQKDSGQQIEIDSLKNDLKIERAQKLELQIALAAANEVIDVKDKAIARLEREKIAALMHKESVIIQTKIDEISDQISDLPTK